MQRYYATAVKRAIIQKPASLRTPVYRTFVTSRALFQEAKETEVKEEAKELSPLEKELAEVKAKLEKKDKDYVELKDSYTRSVADFRNLQETTRREIQKAKDFALQKFAKDLIESIDNFGHALSSVKEDSIGLNNEVSQLYDGVKMTKEVFEKTLSKHGLQKIDPMDEEFDPNKHEATFQAPHAEKEAGTVFYVQQPGYELNGRVLRAAKVGVVKGDD